MDASYYVLRNEPRARLERPRRAAPVPRGPVAELLRLQSTLGNRSVLALIARQQARRGGRDEDRAERSRRDQERDEDVRRAPGGRQRRRWPAIDDFDSDWAGRAILGRYLNGEGDWTIEDDPAWTAYMQANPRLRRQVRSRVTELVRRIARDPSATGVVPARETFQGALENGEGIIGYQYLHGTHSRADGLQCVGGFDIAGTATVRRVGLASYPDRSVAPGVQIDLALHYRWTDVIDPNGSYWTDTVKNWIAEAISAGAAEHYRIDIGWTSFSRCTVYEGGRVEGDGRFPFQR